MKKHWMDQLIDLVRYELSDPEIEYTTYSMGDEFAISINTPITPGGIHRTSILKIPVSRREVYMGVPTDSLKELIFKEVQSRLLKSPKVKKDLKDLLK